MFGLKDDWALEVSPRYFTLEDYEGGVARWCPGCGDLAVLTAVQRIVRDEQLPPEKIVAVSGIGCSSRFPHYMKTYGFHGLHGRALPVACGIKARRPDLDIWVATGDGDCCSIGAGHWVHARCSTTRCTASPRTRPLRRARSGSRPTPILGAPGCLR
jgi:2-oxoglutarate ferredoxin oxidoreductase subunit beta